MIYKLIHVLKEEGFFGFFSYAYRRYSIKKKLITLLISPISLPLSFFILLVSPWVKIRLIMLYSNRIGHYSWNTEFWLCALEKDANPKKNYKNVFYTVPGYSICNTQLHRMWKRIIHILPFPYIFSEVDKWLLRLSENYRNDLFKKFFMPRSGAWDAWNLIERIDKPHIAFTEQEEKLGEALIKKLNIPQHAQYICLVGRDDNYLKVHMPSENLSYDNYRNVDINNYQKAIKYLVSQGYYVIRMGKYVKDKLSINHPMVIDYANSPLQSDFGDIYLSAKCFFFISVATGLDSIPYIFKRPILQTNVPVFDSYIWPCWRLFITKKIYSNIENKFLSQKEISEIFHANKINGSRLVPKICKELSLEFIENTPDEILAVVIEMLDLLKGNKQYTAEDNLLQKMYWYDFYDTDIASTTLQLPELTVPQMKLPMYREKNLEYNNQIARIWVRLGTQFLNENKLWLINNPKPLIKNHFESQLST